MISLVEGRRIVSVTFLPGLAAQDIDRILQPQFLGRDAVDFQNLIAGQNAGLRRRRVFHRRDHGEQSVLDRDLDAEAVEPAAGVVLHVLEVVRVHELAVRIERGKHALHRGVDQVVIADLVAIDVILPDQLDRLREGGDLRVAAVSSAGVGAGCGSAACASPAQRPRRNAAAAEQSKARWSEERFIDIMLGRDRMRLSFILRFLPTGRHDKAADPLLRLRPDENLQPLALVRPLLVRLRRLGLGLRSSAAKSAEPSPSPRAKPESGPEAEFDKLRARLHQRLSRRPPAHGVALGLHEYDGKIGDYSRLAIDAEMERLKRFENELSNSTRPS